MVHWWIMVNLSTSSTVNQFQLCKGDVAISTRICQSTIQAAADTLLHSATLLGQIKRKWPADQRMQRKVKYGSYNAFRLTTMKEAVEKSHVPTAPCSAVLAMAKGEPASNPTSKPWNCHIWQQAGPAFRSRSPELLTDLVYPMHHCDGFEAGMTC